MPTADFSHLVTNPRMKRVLSDCGHLDSATLGKGYELKLGVYKHCCTSGPSTWYRKGGINLYWWNGKGPKGATVEDMKAGLQRAGMVIVYHCSGLAAKKEFTRANSATKCRPGDIGSMISASSAHGVMWTGQDWRSDCIEPDHPYPYSQEGRGGDWSFILWRHPSLQEPGVDIMGGGFGGGAPTGGEGAKMKDFNIEPYEIKKDEKGQYTEEPILIGIANHIHIGGSASGAGLAGGELGEAGQSIIDTSNIKERDAAVVARGVYIARGLSSRMGISIMQACGIAGYCSKESSCNPKSANKSEKTGTSSTSTNYANAPGCYGAGIAQWTNVKFKDQNLAVIGKPPGTPIESLSMDEQLDMYAKGSLGKQCLEYGMKTAQNLDVATCLACILGHGSGAAKAAYKEAGNNINNEAYIKACMSRYPPFKNGQVRNDIPKARKFAQQCFDACSRGEMGSPT